MRRPRGHRGRDLVMTVYARLTRWLARRRAERDHFALDRAAGHMLADYRRAVERGDSREVLAGILTGVAGCELAMSRTNPAMGWGMEPDEDGCTVGESSRRSGLLVLELARCAASGPIPAAFTVSPELASGGLQHILAGVALAYAGCSPDPVTGAAAPGGPVPVGELLDDLWHVVVDVIGAQAAEVLVPLMAAHGHDGYARGGHRGPSDSTDPSGGAAADEQDAMDWGDGPTGDEFAGLGTGA